MADIIYEDYYGSVIKVDGACYNFLKEVPDDLTQDPPPDALFDTCEECSSSSQSDESSPSFPEDSSASEVPVPLTEITCDDCDPPLHQAYIVEVWLPEDYAGSFELYRGDHTVYWTEFPACSWVGGPGNNVKLFFGDDGWTIEVTPSATDRIMGIRLSGDRCDGPSGNR